MWHLFFAMVSHGCLLVLHTILHPFTMDKLSCSTGSPKIVYHTCVALAPPSESTHHGAVGRNSAVSLHPRGSSTGAQRLHQADGALFRHLDRAESEPRGRLRRRWRVALRGAGAMGD